MFYGIKIYPAPNACAIWLRLNVKVVLLKYEHLVRGLSLRERPVSYQLVGEVKAHQGYDG
ncbi:MAG: hypothetical protein QG620_35 [Patescibacteria group bacterium]|nr:hypothetical protein [Patescibacteria group bacterium]